MLVNGDCIVEMYMIGTGSVDMILTDPPYGMAFQSNHRNEKYDKIKSDDNLEWLHEWFTEAFRIVKNNTAHYIFCSHHNVDLFIQNARRAGFKLKNILVWEKNNTSMGDLKGDFAPKVEFILFLTKGRRLINGSRSPNIMKFNRTGNKLHPTQKPVDLLEHLIEKFSDEGDLIFDPFMGSGSTGVACANTNRKFHGVELDKDYYDIAVERINLTTRAE